MPQNFLKNKVLFALGVTALLSKIAQLQMFAANKFPITPEQHRLERCTFILEGEIGVTGAIMIGIVGDLPFDIHFL